MYIFSAIIITLVLIILLGAYIAFKITFASERKENQNLYRGLTGEIDEVKSQRRKLIERIADIPFESISIKSYDGLTLHARYYHVKDGAPLAIQFHGYKSMSLRDFSGAGYECIKREHNLILVDQRAHGKSGGRAITFGAKEKRDVKAWIDYALARFGGDTKIILYGMSMGAGTVLMASESGLPENIVGIVADCPFSSAKEIIKKVIFDKGLPANLLYPFVRIGALIYGGFDPNRASPASSVKNTDIPILLIHGDADNFVPCSMSENISKSGKTVTYIKIKNATHGLSYIYGYDDYMSALDSFLKENLGE